MSSFYWLSWKIVHSGSYGSGVRGDLRVGRC